MSTSDDEDEVPIPPRRSRSEDKRQERKRKIMKLQEEDDEDDDERELKKKKKTKKKRDEDEDEEEEEEEEEIVQEDAKPIGEVVRLSGKGRGRRSHYEAFEFDGNRYDLVSSYLYFGFLGFSSLGISFKCLSSEFRGFLSYGLWFLSCIV